MYTIHRPDSVAETIDQALAGNKAAARFLTAAASASLKGPASRHRPDECVKAGGTPADFAAPSGGDEVGTDVAGDVVEAARRFAESVRVGVESLVGSGEVAWGSGGAGLLPFAPAATVP